MSLIRFVIEPAHSFSILRSIAVNCVKIVFIFIHHTGIFRKEYTLFNIMLTEFFLTNNICTGNKKSGNGCCEL